MATGVKVLIAAGKVDDAKDLAGQAENAGFRVIAKASSGKEAITLAEAQHPDIVLIDTRLPGSRGIPAVIKKIQESTHIPVVIVANSDDEVFLPRKNAPLPAGCLVRPFKTRQFQQVIRIAILQNACKPQPGGAGDKHGSVGSSVDRIAHDINNSLSSALANIQITRRSCIEDGAVCDHLDSAEASVLRARDQSRQLFTPAEKPESENGALFAEINVQKRSLKGAGAKKKAHAGGYRILLMDDEPAILSATSEMLSFLGHDVTVAENGDTAVSLYKQALIGPASFDAVILDITVPGGKGAAETLPLIRALDPGVRVIISSGYATHPLVVDFATSGFVAALVKPYGFKELEESLSRAFL